jgi:hypothetical protein
VCPHPIAVNSVTEAQLENLRLIYLQFSSLFVICTTSVERFFLLVAPEKHPESIKVSKSASSQLAKQFAFRLSTTAVDLDCFSPCLARIFGARLQSRHEQRTEKGNVIIYLNYVKMFELPSDKSEFHGQFTRLRIKAIGAMIR